MLTTSLMPLLAAGTGITLGILGIAFLIFVHELGHYLACRLTKTRVETFSIGFGPRILGWEQRPGEARRLTVGRRRLDPAEHAMDFRLAAIPLGGYVKMAGENPGEERTGAPDEFPNRPMWARVFIISAGVIMNVIAACVLYFIAFAGHVEVEPPIVGDVQVGGPAWEAGIQPGDRILSIEGQPVRSFIEMKMETVFLAKGDSAEVEIERGGERLTVQVTPRYDDTAGAMLLGVSGAFDLTLTDGDRTVLVGSTDPVRIAGIETRGGRAAFDLLQAVLPNAPDGRVTVQVGDDEPVAFAFPLTADAPQVEPPVFKIGIEPFQRVSVAQVRGPAADVLQQGDVLLRFVGKDGLRPLESNSDLQALPFQAPVRQLHVTRGSNEMVLDVALATPQEVYDFLRGVAVEGKATAAVKPLPAGTLVAQSARYPSAPAADAGIQPGETVLTIGEKPVADFSGIVDAVGGVTTAAPLALRVRAVDGTEREVTLRPVPLQRLDGIDIRASVEPYRTQGLGDALGTAVAKTGHEIRGIFRLIGAFFTGGIDFKKNVAGPATIVAVSADRAEQSFLQLLTFLAYISVSLAVLNILPIPVLDGGHLMFLLIEKIKGTPVKDETIGKLQFVGLMLLLVLMFFAFRNDFLNLTGR